MSCVTDGILVFSFVLLKSIMPVFLAQLLIQFQLPPKIDNATSVDNYETTTTAAEFTTTPTPFVPSSNDDDAGFWDKVSQCMLFIW